MPGPTVSNLAVVGSATVDRWALYQASFTLSVSYANPDADAPSRRANSG